MAAKNVHSARFYNLETNGIECMAYDEFSDLLALVRTDNTIEIWNLANTPHVERTIHATYDTIHALAWFERKLFSVGHQGSIIEYDLLLQCPKSMHPLTSGASYCVDVCSKTKRLAAGTEDGFINIFDISGDELVYNKLLDKQEGRIYCLVWDHKGEHIISGSVDTVRVWNVSTGHAVQRLMTGRSINNKETIVWSVAVASDFTIISGDSRGKLCFWDGLTGINITSYQSLKADVLAICLSQDENTVYCAGVDPSIACYERVKVRGSDEKGIWIKSIQRLIHEHEVKSLVICDDKLFSAGLDGYLAMSSYPPKSLVKFPPFLQPPSAMSTQKSKSLLLRYPTSLDIWKFESSTPKKLIEWKTSNEARIKCAALSDNGIWLAVSTPDRFRLFSLSYEANNLKVNRVQIPSKTNLTAFCLCFSKRSDKLAVATKNCHIHVLELTETPNIIESHYPLRDKHFSDSVGFIEYSSDGKYLIASDLHSNVIVIKDNKVYVKLPKYACSITALAVQPETNLLFIAYADHKFVEYSLYGKKYTGFSRQLQESHPKQWLGRNFPIHSISFDPSNKDIIFLNDDSTILVVNKQKELPQIDEKIPRLSCGSNSDLDLSENSNQHPLNNSPKGAFHVLKKYKHLVYFGNIKDNDMVAVEVSPLALKEKLTSSFKQKRFGRT